MYLTEQIYLTVAALAAWFVLVNVAFWAYGRLERMGLRPWRIIGAITALTMFLLLLVAIVVPTRAFTYTLDTFSKATTQRFSLKDDSATPTPTVGIIQEVNNYPWRMILAPPPVQDIALIVSIIVIIIWVDGKLNRRKER